MSIFHRTIFNRHYLLLSKRFLASSTASELKLSDSCVRRLQAICKDKSDKLRVFVEGGGCSGFQYKFTIESNNNLNKEEQDRIFERDGAQIIVDKDSLELLKGSTVDYQEELIRSSFRILNNPNAEQGCSCGSIRAINKGRRITNIPSRAAITLTETAVRRVKEILNARPDSIALRIGVRQRGCNGLSYTLDYAKEKKKMDEEVNQDGIKLLIDPKAQLTLLGTEMDFVQDKLASEFVFNNPNIKGTCGCGESFNF
ncbi:unnamed protein product [Rotaria socialis]|uniref:Iron-sulfur cluster assembly 1 homolog, mitochondrial n=1 Tax=Rotaria socialis TaxID=392032 RepID=A0A817SYZ0_9BILA|nr:unnamed protein product [Rotaria socialis]CAF3304128.1 unnamed protein product [Rotaria socialis]CAF3306957.1 unnamed protein product [Rotaria socialis]CAF4124439.1 unnamed protein product [Rotaria socialis]CAF4175082.1 unnamed protein product [Rotaria socialis]